MPDVQKPLQNLVIIRRVLRHRSGLRQDFAGIGLSHHFGQPEEPAAIHTAQHGVDLRLMNLTFTEGNGLICQAQRIPHTALRSTPQRPERRLVVRHRLRLQHFTQITNNTFRRHIFEAELQAARKDSHGELLWIGRRQQKFNVFRRLFERFQQGVKTVG